MEYSVLALPPPRLVFVNYYHILLYRTLLSSCSSSCKCSSDECTNKPFQQRHIKKMKLVQTEKCGYGIVAEEDIKQGEFIIEYVGEGLFSMVQIKNATVVQLVVENGVTEFIDMSREAWKIV
ncbi:unnamed protein product [Cochlearia groenlandica]